VDLLNLVLQLLDLSLFQQRLLTVQASSTSRASLVPLRVFSVIFISNVWLIITVEKFVAQLSA
jgi:hypothetical protein